MKHWQFYPKNPYKILPKKNFSLVPKFQQVCFELNFSTLIDTCTFSKIIGRFKYNFYKHFYNYLCLLLDRLPKTPEDNLSTAKFDNVRFQLFIEHQWCCTNGVAPFCFFGKINQDKIMSVFPSMMILLFLNRYRLISGKIIHASFQKKNF
jgi:hypothetical protein